MRKCILIFLFCCPLFNGNLFGKTSVIDSLRARLPYLKSDTASATVLIELARAYNIKQKDSAYTYASKALRLSRKLDSKPQVVLSLNALGGSFLHRNDSLALSYYQHAYALADSINYIDGKARTSHNLGHLYESINEYEKAESQFRKSIDWYTLKKDSSLIPKLIADIGLVYLYKNEIKKAFAIDTMAYRLALRVSEKSVIERIAGNLGYFALNHADYPNAIMYFQESLKLCQELEDTVTLARTEMNLGATHYYLADYEKSLHFSFLALKHYGQLHDSSNLTIVTMNIGEAYRPYKKYLDALKYYNISLSYAKKLKDSAATCTLYWCFGETYICLKDYEKAMQFCQQSLALANRSHSLPDIAHATKCIGLIYWNSLESPSTSADHLVPAGRKARIDLAIANFNRVIEIADEAHTMDALQESHEKLAAIYKQLGDYKRSLSHYELYTQLKDSIFSNDKAKKMAVIELQAEHDKMEAAASAEQARKDLLVQQKSKRQQLFLNALGSGFVIVCLFALVFFRQRNRIKQGKQRSDELLLNILPEEVAEELKTHGSAEARQFDEVTVMFTDFKDFTLISEKLTPKELVSEIHTCFKAFDDIISKYSIEKIKTIGDSYMCVSGLPVTSKTHAADMVNAAMEIQAFMRSHKQDRKNKGMPAFDTRIGIHSGTVVAGIVGVKKFAYDIWGDTVNTASRIESNGDADKINISSTTYELVKDRFQCSHRGKIQVKGKGELDMYFVEGKIA